MKKLVLNQEIYSEQNINEAKRAYKDIASIMIGKKKNSFVACFLYCKYDEDRTVREFENYLIGLEIM